MKKILFYSLLASCIVFNAKSQITIDGTMSDWDNIPTLSEPGVFPILKTTKDDTNLSVMVNLGSTESFADRWQVIDVYIDTDNNAATGYQQWVYSASGVDYLAQGTDLYVFTGAAGSSSWSWGGAGTVTRSLSADLHAVEQSIALADLTTPAIGTTYGITTPYYNSEWTTGDPQFLPANDWNFSERKTFTVKPRTEVNLSTIAEFTSGNAYYYPFMRDANIDQYLDFQSGAYATQNPLHWASWALNLVTPGNYNVKMVSSSTGSGKFQLSLVDVTTNQVVKTFTEAWYPANATMTENTYDSIDLTDVAAGKYMLKLMNPTTWDTHLKVQKITLDRIMTSVSKLSADDYAKFIVQDKTLNVLADEVFDMAIYAIDGRLVDRFENINSISRELNSGVYIITIGVGDKSLNKKIMIK